SVVLVRVGGIGNFQDRCLIMLSCTGAQPARRYCFQEYFLAVSAYASESGGGEALANMVGTLLNEHIDILAGYVVTIKELI
ncbi:MAG TPA: hypothetical protein VFO07_09565, partial [Roseiflexaceae bacterium]|nr:hypothetical protein [Roseiflexaceae bacterium]